MNAPKKIAMLELELLEAGVKAKLTLTPEGVKVSAPTTTDRLLAIAELRRRGVIVSL